MLLKTIHNSTTKKNKTKQYTTNGQYTIAPQRKTKQTTRFYTRYIEISEYRKYRDISKNIEISIIGFSPNIGFDIIEKISDIAIYRIDISENIAILSKYRISIKLSDIA